MTIGDVVDSVRRVTDIMSEIASASQEQSDGIEQVNGAISQMDQVTQQNAALVEEAAAAAASMQDQAARLEQAVSFFRVDEQIARKAAPPATQAKPRAAAPARKALAGTAGEAEWEQF
jgi:uncharacterized phage infection (PIP) family protein YhgE